MNNIETYRLSSILINKAKDLGADLVGFALIKDVKNASSYNATEAPPDTEETARPALETEDIRYPLWPKQAKSVMVIAIHHPDDKPYLDWWFGKMDPPGNRLLSEVISRLCEWIKENYKIGVAHLPYHVEKGGIYLKDAGVLAGLGHIGRNNLLITQKYGPRVRLRALALDVEFPSSGALSFNPCQSCKMWCIKACHQHALERRKRDPQGSNICSKTRKSFFWGKLCKIQMQADIKAGEKQMLDGFKAPVKIIKYCRKCELACPIGKRGKEDKTIE